VASSGALEEITVASKEIAVASEEIAVASEEIAVALEAKHYVYVVLDVAKSVWEKTDAAVESSLLVLMETSF